MMPVSGWLSVPGVLVVLLAAGVPVQAGLYSADEPLVSLAGSARSLLLGSSSSWLAEFYASWCGHCRNFKETWSALARDVQDWRPAVYLCVLDCAEESNSETCSEFGITGYPSMKFFKAFAEKTSDGVRVSGYTVDSLRKQIIDRLEEQKESPPPACPPLEPISTPELDQFFENNSEEYLAVIFEENKMYMGREVALDMLQFEGISVRRVVKDQTDLIEKFKVSSFPTGFLFSKNGSVSRIDPGEETRSSYTNLLRSLPGVKRANHRLIGWSEKTHDDENTVIRKADNSKVYMADLESALHYSLRVEVGRFHVLEGERLKALSNFVNVVRKYLPARPYLRTLLNSLYVWLRARTRTKVLFDDFEDVLNNKNMDQKAVLSSEENYVGCQGSKPEFRGFPCSLWTLFHMLTVQASEMATQRTVKPAPREVLSAMRGYVKYFFGCRECAEHFERMAQESLRTVRTLDEAIKWLWERHNRVNKRLAGAASEDPDFPKVQWPTPELCPLCQVKTESELVTWDDPNVMHFMKTHFSKDNIADAYLVDEDVLLEKQKKANEKRDKRDVTDQENKEEIKVNEDFSENTFDKKQEEGGKMSSVHKKEPKDRPRHKPTIIKMKPAVPLKQAVQEEILDLDSYGQGLFLSRSLQDSSLHKENRALHPKVLHEPQEADFDEAAVRSRLLKRGVDTQYLMGVVIENGDVNWKGRWVKMLEGGFSRLDISLCVLLYFLSSMCLFAMYLYMSLRKRCLRKRYLFPQA
ncbi:sulfhydryl oxidase 1 [Pelobates cultripes]|uniref:Sulfhydryl oxidase n=1 Tax=Pelobates cultripes TaxID=61616 RepID=A0AAD1SUF5_PELCU|nr:sulfhydryl oxidase 1 [Pelobates cultripes]